MALLLAPGGNPDAVYVGLRGWSRGGARSELEWPELEAAARRADAHGAELQVALNTIPRPRPAPDLGAARAALDPVLAERDRWRAAKTGTLHQRLLVRMEPAAGPPSPGPGTDWDPAPEEARLSRAEAAS
jgi:hypothetical protein